MINLPALFEKKLSQIPSLAASVTKTFDSFEPWLEQSGMPFFPGFTDHSPRHVNDVLNTAASLISDTSHELLGAEDVAVLCMAVLLHDCGMHLTQDAFRALVSDNNPPLLVGMGDVPWAQLWKDFLAEASRFGQEKLTAIFGDSDPLRVGDIRLDNLSERDCLLIGEFVRRHHTRLAHEIAIGGVSRKNGEPLLLGFDDLELRDIAGLVARSHGMSIRSTFDYISDRYGIIPIYRNIKIPYLMAVLRIADYVQVRSERAIKALLSVKELRSPVSRQEWLNHFAVKDVSTEHADPEALHVQAAPIDVKTFLRLTALFRDIQRELDESWATLGEVYGRSMTLSPLGLTIRRIRSNLDAIPKFAKGVPYIPVKANFESSGPDLLKLLVGPLYDYDYSVGIREIVQNAVDACREAADLAGAESPIEPTVQVEIEESEDGTGWITVTDTGVGMTVDTVTRYFLIAGASFRNSDIWKTQHVDDSGRPRVMRGGRFGIGALAAFLLGDEITVTTRHVNKPEDEGVEFTARIDDPVVELRKKCAPSGTRIRIRVSNPEVFQKLRPSIFGVKPGKVESKELTSWPEVDWFVLPKPKVSYFWDGYDRRHVKNGTPRTRFTATFTALEKGMVPISDYEAAGWRALEETGSYSQILWKYFNQREWRGEMSFRFDEVIVNGIRVQDLPRHERSAGFAAFEERGSALPYTLYRPSMAISDPAGVCPINLQRSAIAFNRMETEGFLVKTLLEDHFRRFVQSAQEVVTVSDFGAACDVLKDTRTVSYDTQVAPLFIVNQGVSLLTPGNLHALGVKTLFFVDCEYSKAIEPISAILDKGEALVLRHGQVGLQARTTWFRGYFSLYPSHDTAFGNSADLPYLAETFKCLYMRNEEWVYVNEKNRIRRDIMESVTSEPFGLSHRAVFRGSHEHGQSIRQRIENVLGFLPQGAEVGAWALAQTQPHAAKKSVIGASWQRVIGDIILRYRASGAEKLDGPAHE